jgi:hypothetical protein
MVSDAVRAGRRSRRRGARGELEVVDILRAHGWTGARRNFESQGQKGGDITGGPADVHWEVKRVEKLQLRKAWAQAVANGRPTDMRAVAHRCNGEPWLVTVELVELLELLAFRERA